MINQPTIAVLRTGPGEFVVTVGGAHTNITIWNGSMGFRGNGAGNTYGVQQGEGKIIWAGTLQQAKKWGIAWAKKQQEAAR
jgi:hypothetical protein